MRRLPLLVFAIAALAATPAQAGDAQVRTVDDFLAQWRAIKATAKMPGQRSEAVKEGFELSQVLDTLFGRYKLQLAEDKKNGKPPRACPVKGSKLDFTLDELAGSFTALPANEPIDQAYFAFLDKKLPCANA